MRKRIKESMNEHPILWGVGGAVVVAVLIGGIAVAVAIYGDDWLRWLIEIVFGFISKIPLCIIVAVGIGLAVWLCRKWRLWAWIETKLTGIKESMGKHPILWSVVGVILLPVILAALATWSVWLIEELFECFGKTLEMWLSGGDSAGDSEGDSKGSSGENGKGSSGENGKDSSEENSKSGLGYRINVLIGLGSVLGIAALGWRNYALQQQAKAAFDQAKAANKQADIEANRTDTAAQQAKTADKRADREHKARISNQYTQAMTGLARVDNSGNPLKEERIGNLYTIESLAHDDPEGYGVRVMKGIVAYICDNAQKTEGDMPEETGNADTDEQRARPLGEDVKVAFAVLKKLYDQHARTPEKRKKMGLVRFFDDGEPSARQTFEPKKPVRDDLDFSRADFHELDFRSIDWIDRPCCDRANFQKANLWGAKLAGAHLEEALLQKVYAYGIVLYEANLRDAQLYKAKLKRADLRKAKLESAKLDEAELERAKLDEANLTFACLYAANLDYAQLNEVILEHSPLCAASIYGAELYGANLAKAWLHGVNLQMSRLVGADLSGAKLQGANLCNAMLQGADLENAQLDYGFWEHTNTRVQDDNVRNLESLLEGKVGNYAKVRIVNRFNAKGNKGLWRPKSAKILCHEEFAPRNYQDNPAILLKPDEDSVDSWQKKWEEIIGNFGQYKPPSPYGKSHRYIIQGFINIHGQRYYPIGSPRGSQNEFRCAHGLRAAVKDLIERLYKVVDEFEVKDWFSEGYMEWIYEGNPSKPPDTKS